MPAVANRSRADPMRRPTPHPGCPASTRALELARRFTEANDEVIAFVEGLSDTAWSTPCEGGARTVGQVIGHIAAGHLVIGGIAEAIAFGRPLPVAARRTEVTGARYNAQQARRFAGSTRGDALRALRRNGGIVARFVAGLTDEGLDRTITTAGGPVSAEAEVEGSLLGHLALHFAEVRDALA
jgi:hypothetical protein